MTAAISCLHAFVQPTFAIFGDMGVDVNALRTLPLLTQDVVNGVVDVVLHVGGVFLRSTRSALHALHDCARTCARNHAPLDTLWDLH